MVKMYFVAVATRHYACLLKASVLGNIIISILFFFQNCHDLGLAHGSAFVGGNILFFRCENNNSNNKHASKLTLSDLHSIKVNSKFDVA